MCRSLHPRCEIFHLPFTKSQDSVLTLLAVWQSSSIKTRTKEKGCFFTFSFA